MNYKQFEYINKTISSEMFYTLMAILHERLPCSKNFFRMKKTFRDREIGDCSSPVRTIASPKMIRGLSITKTPTIPNSSIDYDQSRRSDMKSQQKKIGNDVRITNRKPSIEVIRKLSL